MRKKYNVKCYCEWIDIHKCALYTFVYTYVLSKKYSWMIYKMNNVCTNKKRKEKHQNIIKFICCFKLMTDCEKKLLLFLSVLCTIICWKHIGNHGQMSRQTNYIIKLSHTIQNSNKKAIAPHLRSIFILLHFICVENQHVCRKFLFFTHILQ